MESELKRSFEKILECIQNKDKKHCYERAPAAVRIFVESPTKTQMIGTILGYPLVRVQPRLFARPGEYAIMTVSDEGLFEIIPTRGHIFDMNVYFDILKGEMILYPIKYVKGKHKAKVEAIEISPYHATYINYLSTDKLGCGNKNVDIVNCPYNVFFRNVAIRKLIGESLLFYLASNYFTILDDTTLTRHEKVRNIIKLSERFGTNKNIAASDPDAEGERIANEIANILKNQKFTRAKFHEITNSEVTRAIKEALERGWSKTSMTWLDKELYMAGLTRAIEDEIEGLGLSVVLQYILAILSLNNPILKTPSLQTLINLDSLIDEIENNNVEGVASMLVATLPTMSEIDPFVPEVLFEKLKAKIEEEGTEFALRAFFVGEMAKHIRNNSIGRVQTTVLWWLMIADKLAKKYKAYRLILEDEEGNKVILFSKEKVKDKEGIIVPDGEIYEVEVESPPPATTADVLQFGSNIGLSASETMQILQSLYQNGFITYPRTDSVHISYKGVEIIKEIIKKLGMNDEVTYKFTSKSLMGHHEAIRPTTPLTPEEVMINFANERKSWAYGKIYAYIVARAMASQLNSAKVKKVKGGTFKFNDKVELFTMRRFDFDELREVEQDAVTEVIREGWMKAFKVLELSPPISVVKSGKYKVIHVTEYPYVSEAVLTVSDLVNKMKKEEIGRPSTYAQIIDTLFRRQYMREEAFQINGKIVRKDRVEITPIGKAVAIIGYVLFKALEMAKKDKKGDFDAKLIEVVDELSQRNYDLKDLIEMSKEMNELAKSVVKLIKKAEEGEGEVNVLTRRIIEDLVLWYVIAKRSAIVSLASRFRLRITSMYPTVIAVREIKDEEDLREVMDYIVGPIEKLLRASYGDLENSVRMSFISKLGHVKRIKKKKSKITLSMYRKYAKEALTLLLQ